MSVRSDAVEINAADPVSCRIRDKIHHVTDSFPQAAGSSFPWLHALSLKADSAAFQIVVTEHTAQYVILPVLPASGFLLLYFHTRFLLAGGGADHEKGVMYHSASAGICSLLHAENGSRFCKTAAGLSVMRGGREI